jgi:hypothetical protein
MIGTEARMDNLPADNLVRLPQLADPARQTWVKHDMDPGLAEGSAATSTTAGPQLLTLKGGCR